MLLLGQLYASRSRIETANVPVREDNMPFPSFFTSVPWMEAYEGTSSHQSGIYADVRDQRM